MNNDGISIAALACGIASIVFLFEFKSLRSCCTDVSI